MREKLPLFGLLGLALALQILPAAAAPTVTLKDGALIGTEANGAEEFLGVPFAAPPVGPLRWLPPQPVQPWSGPRDATHYASKCTQNGWVSPLTKYRNEDCLYLNVYRPAHSEGKKLPVLFWIHGGASITGSSQDIDGSVMAAREKVVVVSTNYRLGAFGWANIRQVAAAQTEPSGNDALRDWLAGLHWVQSNVAAFGGDPRNVTVIGQSAGGAAVWTLLSSPASAGLFKGAVAMSAGGYAGLRSSAQEQKSGPSSKMVGALQCGDAPDVPACMRAASTDNVYAAGGGFYTRPMGWGPNVDGTLLPDQPIKLAAAGKLQPVPIMAGVVARNGGFFLQWRLQNGEPHWGEAEYTEFVKTLPHADKVLAAFPYSSFTSGDEGYVVVSSAQEACEALKITDAAAQHQPLYFYEFNDPDAPSTIFKPNPAFPKGPAHATDVPYIFQRGFPNEAKPGRPDWTPAQAALSDRMMDYVANFARSGDPKGGWKPGMAWIQDPKGDHAQALADFSKEHKCAAFD